MNEKREQLPAQFGPFYLYDLIGQGGMAEIFLAKTFTSLGTERQAVIKRILPVHSENASFGEMLINEAKLCARLSHANIVQTYDLGQIDERYYIAMEYVEGFDLNQLLGLISKSKLALPLQFALYIVIETLRGLNYAHRLADQDGSPLGIIHRDVSPTNVLISTEGEVKVCDFGIAKVALIDFDAEKIEDYHLKGKVAYMAPEHLGSMPLDRRADLYAAGILLWELLSGRRLYKRKDEEETLRLAKAAEIPPLVDRGFPEFELLAAIVTKALTRQPALRFQSGQEFIAAIDDYLHAAALIVSQLKFSEFLMEHFGERLQTQRRERERALAELAAFREALDSRPPEALPVQDDDKAAAIVASFSVDTDFDVDGSGAVELGNTAPVDEGDEEEEAEDDLDASALLDDVERDGFPGGVKHDDLPDIGAELAADDDIEEDVAPKLSHFSTEDFKAAGLEVPPEDISVTMPASEGDEDSGVDLAPDDIEEISVANAARLSVPAIPPLAAKHAASSMPPPPPPAKRPVTPPPAPPRAAERSKQSPALEPPARVAKHTSSAKQTPAPLAPQEHHGSRIAMIAAAAVIAAAAALAGAYFLGFFS